MTPQRISHAAERDFARRVRDNQAHLKAVLREAYDFVVCGAGTAGTIAIRPGGCTIRRYVL